MSFNKKNAYLQNSGENSYLATEKTMNKVQEARRHCPLVKTTSQSFLLSVKKAIELNTNNEHWY